MWDPQYLTILQISTACYRDSFTFFVLSFYFYKFIAKPSENIHNVWFEIQEQEVLLDINKNQTC
jgi:hypothetical protein